jgi:hypothetical protein
MHLDGVESLRKRSGKPCRTLLDIRLFRSTMRGNVCPFGPFLFSVESLNVTRTPSNPCSDFATGRRLLRRPRGSTRRSRSGGNKLRALADKVDGPQGEKPEPGCRCVSPKSKMCGKYRETIYICWTLEIFEIRRECKCLCETKPICIVSSWTYKIEPVD